MFAAAAPCAFGASEFMGGRDKPGHDVNFLAG
jgi:hypothetical protein